MNLGAKMYLAICYSYYFECWWLWGPWEPWENTVWYGNWQPVMLREQKVCRWSPGGHYPLWKEGMLATRPTANQTVVKMLEAGLTQSLKVSTLGLGPSLIPMCTFYQVARCGVCQHHVPLGMMNTLLVSSIEDEPLFLRRSIVMNNRKLSWHPML